MRTYIKKRTIFLAFRFVLKHTNQYFFTKYPLLAFLATFLNILFLVFCTYNINAQTPHTPESISKELLHKYNTQLHFERNIGQWDNREVLYRANGTQASFQFTSKGVSIGILEQEKEPKKAQETEARPYGKDRRHKKGEKTQRHKTPSPRNAFVWNLNFLDANPMPKIRGREYRSERINYFMNNKERSKIQGKTFNELWYEMIYDRIDARFYGNDEQQLEYDFIVHPGGQVSDIRLEMEGVKNLRLNKKGEIVFQTPMGELKKGSPYTYQKINGKEIRIESRYVLEADKTIRFEVGDYDSNHPLIIDPIVLAYATYFSGTPIAGSRRIAITAVDADNNGNVIVYGYGYGYDFPITPGAVQTAPSVEQMIFKMDPTLNSVIWGTYIIGTNSLYTLALKVDNTGAVYFSGQVNVTNLSTQYIPTTPGAFQETPLTRNDVFFYGKISATGDNLEYLTYLGGLTDVSASGNAREILVDDSGNLLTGSFTYHPNMPVTAGVVQPNYGGDGDWYIASLNPTGTGLNFATYIGGSDWEGSEEINIDLHDNGNIYVGGITFSTDYPFTPGTFAPSFGNAFDRAVITVLNPTATSIIYSTALQKADEYAYMELEDIQIDADGNVYATGLACCGPYTTHTSGLPFFGGDQGFLIKLDPTGNLIFSTPLIDNTSGFAEGTDLAVDEEGDVFVLCRGSNIGNAFDQVAEIKGLNETTPTIGNENYLLKFSADGSQLLYATYINTDDSTIPSSIGDVMAYKNCKLYIGTNSLTVHSNVTPNAFQKSYNGPGGGFNFNGYIAIFDLSARSGTLNTISPSVQNVCIDGRTQVITGSDQDFQASDHIKNGVTYPQIIQVPCQWQASNDGINWEDIPGAVTRDFLPAPTSTDVYYRRICGSSSCDRDTSNVHSVIVGTDAAPTVAPGTVNTCPGTPVQIGAVASGGSGGPYNYSWSPATSLNDTTLAQPTFSGTTGGIYNVIVTDTGNGCEFEEQWQVDVVADNLAGPDVGFCSGDAGARIGIGKNPEFTYAWSVISGDPITSLSNPNIPRPIASPTVTTTYELTVTVPAVGCSVLDTVVVTPLTVTANAGLDTTLCLGEDYVLGGEAAVAGYSYGWAPGIYIGSQTTAQPTFESILCPTDDIYTQTNNPLIYTLTKIHNATGCKDVDTISINLLHTRMDDICGVPTMIGVQEDSCGLDLPGVNFTWSVISGDAGSIVGQENDRYPIVNPSDTTVYHLDVELNGKTCFSELTVTLDCSCTVDIDATSEVNCPVGGAYNTVLNGTVAMPGSFGGNLPTGYHFEWSPTFGLSDPDSLVTEVTGLPQDTTYYLSIIDESDGSTLCIDSIRVYSSIASDPFEGLSVPDYVCAGVPTEIGLPGVAGWAYSWSPITGLSDPNISNPEITVSGNRTYTLTAYDAVTGCLIDAEVEVKVVSPIINVGPDRSFCENAIVELGSPAVTGQTYSWQPTIGLSQPNTAQPLDTLFISTQYFLTVTDTLTGCTATDSVSFTLITPPTIDAGADVYVCSGGGATIGPAPQVGYTYLWSPETGLSDPTAAQPIASPSSNTVYTLLVSNGNPGCYASDEVAVTVGPAYTLDVPDVETCAADSIMIGVPDAGGTYSWSPTTGLGNPNASQTNALPGTTTTYTLTWTTPDGCSIADDATVSILPLPNVTVTNPSICLGESTVIGPSEETGVTYVWTSVSGDPVMTLSATNIARPTATPTQTTVYRVTASRPTGCSAQADVTVTIANSPALDLGSDFMLCGLDTLKATADCLPEAGTTYLWNTGSTDPCLPITTPLSPTSYTVTVTNSAGCTSTDNILVSPPYDVDAGFNRSICPGESITIGMADLGAGYTYSWSPTTGLSSSTVSNPTASPTVNTTYTLTVDNGAGCILTDDITIEMKQTPTLETISAQTICMSSCTELEILNPESGVTYYWSPSASLSSSTGTSVIACPSGTTTYTVTAVSPENCTASTNTTINVLPTAPPAIDAGIDQTVCSGETVSLGTLPSAGITYYWTSPDAGGVSALSDPAVSNPTATINNTSNTPLVRTFILEATDNSTLCNQTDTVVITVNGYPTINITTFPTLCSGGTISSDQHITVSGSNLEYQWSPVANVSDPTAANPALLVTDTTDFIITVTDTLTGCATQKSFTINASSEQVTADAGPDLLLCRNELVQIGSPAQGGVSYLWWASTNGGTSYSTSSWYYFNGTTRTFAQPYPRTSSSGSNLIYRLRATGATGCVSYDHVAVSVVDGINLDAGPDQVLCGGDSTNLNAASISAGEGRWSQVSGPNTASIADTTTNVTAVTGLVQGVYVFAWTVTGDAVCNPGTDEVTIEVVNEPTLVTNDVPNCDGADLTDPSVTAGSSNLGTLTYWFDATATFSVPRADSVATPGTYYIKTIADFGCEATAPVLVFNPPIDTTDISATICEIETYSFNGQALNTSGIYLDTLSQVNGCDSIIRLTLTVLACDWGDLPDISSGTGTGDYQTLNVNSGPYHYIISGLNLGTTIDGETDGFQSILADGDGTDEDGFSFPEDLNIYPGITINRPLDITNTTGIIAHLEGWIDWNGDGDFEDMGEMVVDISDDSNGDFGQSSIPINIPSTAVQNQYLGVRFRLSHSDNMTPYGAASAGEVEDYVLQLGCPPTRYLPIKIIINNKGR